MINLFTSERVVYTPQESERLQKAYEEKRHEWRKQAPERDTKKPDSQGCKKAKTKGKAVKETIQ